MKKERIHIALKLLLITATLSLLSAYGQTDPNSTESFAFKAQLLGLLWLHALPISLLIVLVFGAIWYSIKWVRNRRIKN